VLVITRLTAIGTESGLVGSFRFGTWDGDKRLEHKILEQDGDNAIICHIDAADVRRAAKRTTTTCRTIFLGQLSSLQLTVSVKRVEWTRLLLKSSA
jgi:hypothetical protein